MKSDKKNSALSVLCFLGETVLICDVGIFSSNINLPIWTDMIIYILLLAEIILVLKLVYKLCNTNSKFLAVIAFIILEVCYCIFYVIKRDANLSNINNITYEFLMGYFAFCGSLVISKCNEGKTTEKVAKYIGLAIFALSVIMGFLALFGIAK